MSLFLCLSGISWGRYCQKSVAKRGGRGGGGGECGGRKKPKRGNAYGKGVKPSAHYGYIISWIALYQLLEFVFLSILELQFRKKLFFQNVTFTLRLFTHLRRCFLPILRILWPIVYMVVSANIKNCSHSFFSEHK